MNAFGIDIGKHDIFVAQAQPDVRPALWPVHKLPLKDPSWYLELARLLGTEPATVALEPTGWYASRPIVETLRALAATPLFCAHHATKSARDHLISSQKTDASDAKALAYKAWDYQTGRSTYGMRLSDPATADLTIEYRLLLMDRQRAVRASTQSKNRLSILAHGIWPLLSHNITAYRHALRCGAASPAELHALAAQLALGERPAGIATRAANSVIKLAASLPRDLREPPLRMLAAILQAHAAIDAAAALVAAIDLEIPPLNDRPPVAAVTAVWRTVPAVSELRIALLHAACNCAAEHYDADEFKAAMGCHPCRQESGQITETRETKRGNKPAKATLHLWTLALLAPISTPPNAVRDYFAMLHRQHNTNAIHAARAKLCRILSGIARTNTPYRYPPAGPRLPADEPISTWDEILQFPDPEPPLTEADPEPELVECDELPDTP